MVVRLGDPATPGASVLRHERVHALAAPALLARLPPLRRPADLAGSDNITTAHLSEAIQCRRVLAPGAGRAGARCLAGVQSACAGSRASVRTGEAVMSSACTTKPANASSRQAAAPQCAPTAAPSAGLALMPE